MRKKRAVHENDCPKCFADAASCGQLPACKTCPYTESCRYCADNPLDGAIRDSRSHHVSIEHYQYAEDIAENEKPLCDDEEQEQQQADKDYNKPIYSAADLQKLLEFMLRGVDDYSLAIVECVLREEHTTASDVAKAFSVSREAIHRKLLDCCRQYPYLADMLRCTLQRCKMLADPANRQKITGRRVRRKVDNGGNDDEVKGNKQEQMELF